jgi:arylsulfatase A-like enzyme
MNKTTIAANFFSGCLLFSWGAGCVNPQKEVWTVNEKPNIIFIMADDLGYGDLGCYGQSRIKTPNIDRIAREGIRFTNAYAGSSVCAPSRSALMQGLHTGNARVRRNSQTGYRETLREGDYTVAMMLQDAGYKTGMFGKWGLGLHDQYGIPRRMGFDEFFGYLNQQHAHNHYPEFLYHNETRVYFPENGIHHTSRDLYYGDHPYDENGICHPLGIDDPSEAKYAFDVYCEKSLEFVRNNKDGPFFLYLPYTPPHGAFVAPELGIYTHEEWPLPYKVWAAMVTRIDNEVGKLMDLLAELGIDDNTLVFFTSDNGNIAGPSRRGDIPSSEFFNNGSPTRGSKGGILNGSFHVPMVARWPKHIKPGQVSDHIWAFWDFMPTVAEITGVTVPGNTDGISILPVLLGMNDKQQKHDFLYWEYTQQQAVRMGDWYGVKNLAGTLEVYNLVKNPEQDNDISGSHPEITEKIAAIMQSQHTPSDVWPSPGESEDAFNRRMASLGITEKDRPNNSGNY